ADDALTAPLRVLARHTEDQRSELAAEGRAAGSTCVRPMLCDEPSMPAQQRRRRHEERSPAAAPQNATGPRQKEPVRPRHRRTTDSSPGYGAVVPQHDDFQFFEIVR